MEKDFLQRRISKVEKEQTPKKKADVHNSF